MTTPKKKTLKVDPRTHAQIVDMAEELGISPGELAEEAVIYYMVSCKEVILERIQERVNEMFARVEASTTYTVLPQQQATEGG